MSNSFTINIVFNGTYYQALFVKPHMNYVSQRDCATLQEALDFIKAEEDKQWEANHEHMR